MKVAVVDDEVGDRERIAAGIQRWCQKQGEQPPLLSCYASGESFLAALEINRYDLVLLDCVMNGLTGIQTAERLRLCDRHAKLVFITTSLDYAVDGYLVGASGYLVKPFTEERFDRTFTAAFGGTGGRPDYIVLPCTDGGRRVMVDDIVYCDMAGHYCRLHLGDGNIVRSRMTFAALSGMLAPYRQFLTSYRGCILHMGHVKQIDEYDFLMDIDERVPFRRKERKRLVQQYADYLFVRTRTETL